MKITSNGQTSIKKSGIYFISFNLYLRYISNRKTIAKVVLNSNTDDSNLMVESQRANENLPLEASGFLELLVGDSVSIQILTDSRVAINKGSMLHIRFHESLFSMPGCSFSAASYLTVYRSMPAVVGPWIKRFKGQFTSASNFREKLAYVQIPKDGVYLVSINLITKPMADTSAQLQIVVGDNVSSRFYFSNKQHDTITNSFTDLLSLEETDIVKFKMESDGDIQILESSTFSILLVKPTFLDVNGFKMFLNKDTDNSLADLKSAEYRPIKNWNSTGSEYLFRNFHQSTLVDGYSFSIEGVDGNGVYYVSANIIASVVGASASDVVDVSLYESDNVFFKKKQNLVCTQDNCFFSMNLVAVLQLSQFTPLSIAISGINASKIIFHTQSSFGVVQTPTVHPGFHSGLTKLLKFDHKRKTLMHPWKGGGEGGLYDFTNAFNTTSGVYTTSQKGFYLVTANAIVSDTSGERVSVHIVKDDDKLSSVGFYARDAYPSQQTTLNSGGILYLEKNQTISLYVQAEDEDWQVKGGGLDATFLGSKPLYMQAQTTLDKQFRKIEDVTKHHIDTWRVESSGGIELSSDGMITLPQDGIYYTVATVILDDAAKASSASFYKAQLKIDNKYANGLYSKRKIGLRPVLSSRSSYTLFFSGSFEATKGSKVFIEIETGESIGFGIVQASKWTVVFLRHTDQLSGGLRKLDNDASFKADGLPWRPLDFVAITPTNITAGEYELTTNLNFNGGIVNIYNDGIYIVSANIEIEYTGSGSAMLELGVFINDKTTHENGLNTQKKSLWKAETLHISAGIFLKDGDKVDIRFSSDDFANTRIIDTSSLSILAMTEEGQKATFTAHFKVNYIPASLISSD